MLHAAAPIGDLEIQTYTGDHLPDELRTLRQRVYSEEMGYLTDKTLFNEWDHLGLHVTVREKNSGKIVACSHVYKAEKGEVEEHSGLLPSQLSSGIMITRVITDPDFRGLGLIKLVLYVSAQLGRRWGRNRMFCFALHGERPTMSVLNYQWLPNLKVRSIRGTNNTVHHFHPATQRLEVALRNSWDMMPAYLREQVIKNGLIGDEIVEAAENRIKTFFKNDFFTTVHEQRLTRNNYAWTMANFHQFVRHTTRILARAASITESSGLRRHFIEHLSGEIDHEIQIESDLAVLGADVNFVKSKMQPSQPIEKFMAIQEAQLGYRNDPYAYLAVPFGIEGFSANLDDEFISALEKNISRWGIRNPSRATTFIRSHIVFDGGEDGHWEHNKRTIRKFITCEERAAKFLNILNITFDSMEEIYSDFVSEVDFSEIHGTTQQTHYDKIA